jgi:hypothetical protein
MLSLRSCPKSSWGANLGQTWGQTWTAGEAKPPLPPGYGPAHANHNSHATRSLTGPTSVQRPFLLYVSESDLWFLYTLATVYLSKKLTSVVNLTLFLLFYFILSSYCAVQGKDINNPKGRCGTRLSEWKHPRDALWAFCEETNTCGRGFSAERHLKMSVTSPSGQ